ncbi:LmeA family phospholipid-binding protein [Amycolatopsis cihanbeyliensis]|uniref:LmeA family phospholipid-binding protein n=1 Tax=Amycolatopsis cihanbeyliensis TaxID=1128664 RepID=UPI001FEAA281|nr:DUF2993 domain-containing protein [Amycolatopsis cihanbeyliensis]
MTQPNRPGPAPGGRRRGRRTKKIVIVLVVLLGLLVGADFALAAAAEHTISQKAREQLQLSDDPAVTVRGFPFSVQALSGDYDHISVHATGVPVQDTLRDVEINADLLNVDAPLSDLLNGDVDRIKIGTLEGQVRLKQSDIARVDPLTKIENLRIEPSTEEYVRHGDEAGTDSEGTKKDDSGETEPAEDESSAGIRLSGEVQIAGERLEIFAFAMIRLDGSTVHITPERLQFGNDKETTVVPQEVQEALLPNFEANINTGSLPFTVTPTAIKVESGALVVKGEAKDVTFAGVSQASYSTSGYSGR